MTLFTFKKNKLWIWKAYCIDTGQLIDWECGNRDTNTLKRLLQRLKKWNIKIYITDNWKSYSEMITREMLLQSKK
ncbi:MAG: IS1 family transposase, partial [Firmicutes bacterium]|nr:IS1 family transposase [Bacillota bacterium]